MSRSNATNKFYHWAAAFASLRFRESTAEKLVIKPTTPNPAAWTTPKCGFLISESVVRVSFASSSDWQRNAFSGFAIVGRRSRLNRQDKEFERTGRLA